MERDTSTAEKTSFESTEASTFHISDLIQSDFLKCLLCGNEYQDPRILPCCHSFCAKCVEAQLADKSPEGLYVKCPVCQDEIQVPSRKVHDLEPNFLVIKIQEAATRQASQVKDTALRCDNCDEQEASNVLYCEQCGQLFCSDCRASHDKLKSMKNHVFRAAEDASEHVVAAMVAQPLTCASHRGEQLDFFCKEEETVVCRDCIVTAHNGHACVKLADVTEDCRGVLTNLTAEISSLGAKSEANLSGMEDYVKACESQRNRVKEGITRQANLLKELTDSHCQTLHKIVDDHFDTALKPTVELKGNLSRVTAKYKSLSQFTNNLLLCRSDSLMMVHQKTIRVNLQELIKAAVNLDSCEAPRVPLVDDVAFTPKHCTEEAIGQMFGKLVVDFTKQERPPIKSDGGEMAGDAFHSLFEHFPKDVESDSEEEEKNSESQKTLTTEKVHSSGATRVAVGRSDTFDATSCEATLRRSGDYEKRERSRRITQYELYTKFQDQHRSSMDMFHDAESEGISAPLDAQLLCMFNARLKREKQSKLYGVAIDDQGNIYVIDDSNKKMKLFADTGHYKYAIDLKPHATWPAAMALLPSGNVVISDNSKAAFYDMLFRNPTGSVMIYWTKTREFIRTIGVDKIKKPWGVAINRHSEILVCDVYCKCIFVFQMDGTYVKTIPIGQCKCPMDIAASHVNDTIYVSDSNGHQVVGLSDHGEVIMQHGTPDVPGNGPDQLKFPRGVCVDHFGHIFIADSENHRVVELLPDGSYKRTLATEKDGLKQPVAIATNSKGILVVADWNGNVRVFRYLNDSGHSSARSFSSGKSNRSALSYGSARSISSARSTESARSLGSVHSSESGPTNDLASE
ncbi:tripartite motif-containing protein 2-like [Lingula anatina]|uniref:Tripartite motif-containing protein 2-like n=1 Tax=Lingula anatina TaxID=7574 RepID=A0A1S3H324_LINAN|nr:tripartite motif-containing protein 2-like [Lingula anatina]|eukprot:XP_013379534.1 tripartite motif-containing protein 2-like [Lingula anatina]